MIEVKRTADGDPFVFEVVVREGAGESRHRVALKRATYRKLAGEGSTPEALIDAAFRFLLDREPKESILASFDVDVIGRYFPGFERELPGYLPKA